MLCDIIDGFKELYDKGIVHRDLKPENILIHNGDFKLCDFGFSRHYDKSNDILQTVCGTPLYESL